jgi:hypothetical protein
MEEVTGRCVSVFAHFSQVERQSAENKFLYLTGTVTDPPTGLSWHRDYLPDAPIQELSVMPNRVPWPGTAGGHILLISLPQLNSDLKRAAVFWLQKEIIRANDIISAAGFRVSYQFVNKESVEGNGAVAQVLVNWN